MPRKRGDGETKPHGRQKCAGAPEHNSPARRPCSDDSQTQFTEANEQRKRQRDIAVVVEIAVLGRGQSELMEDVVPSDIYEYREKQIEIEEEELAK